MTRIRLTKEYMEESFLAFMEDVFRHPEIVRACAKSTVIARDRVEETGKQAFAAGFHDVLSDTDLELTVRLPKDGSVTPEEYLRRIDRFGVSAETALGWMFVPENHVWRVIFENGLRYDLCFDFVRDGDETLDMGPFAGEEENPDWPLENVRRFWFTEVQALGKLYRKDHLISAHLANMNCNETLVMQMVMRDQEHATNHHRYGYAEQLEYVSELGKMPYSRDDATFDRIADHLYAAALAYDRLAAHFYPRYQGRSEAFFAIWEAYEAHRASAD